MSNIQQEAKLAKIMNVAGVYSLTLPDSEYHWALLYSPKGAMLYSCYKRDMEWEGGTTEDCETQMEVQEAGFEGVDKNVDVKEMQALVDAYGIEVDVIGLTQTFFEEANAE